MIAIDFPAYNFKIKNDTGKEVIFDVLRKQWLVLTPEEWVRQNFLQYLLQALHCPAALISVEREIAIGELKKRFDIVVFDRNGKPWMLIECKAMGVSLQENVLKQILMYNQIMEAKYLVITNGVFTKGFQLQPTVREMDMLPDFY